MSNIFISVPILDRPELAMVQSLYAACLSSKHKARLYYNTQDSLISRVRNVHLSRFYYDFPECEYFMSLDSDIEIINCYPSNNIFDKLIAHDLDFVGGLYALKRPGSIRCSSVPMNIRAEITYDSGLLEMRWMSSGCWCIKRSAVKKLFDAYPELIYEGDDNATGQKIHGVYIPMLYDITPEEFPEVKEKGRKYLSEDWAMIQRWRQIGGKVWADSSIVLKHIGKIDYSLFNVKVVKASELNKPDSVLSNMPPPAGFDLPKK